MSIADIAPPFAMLKPPPVAEYQQRKVALISGMWGMIRDSADRCAHHSR